jgi:peptidyl-Lys metalloendopeptidase
VRLFVTFLPFRRAKEEATSLALNGGTQDIEYGRSACKELAVSNPGKAIMNADSHEYFAENTPVLS